MIGYVIMGIALTLVFQGLLFVFLGDEVGKFLAELTGYGVVEKVPNKDRGFGNAPDFYLHVKVVMKGKTYYKLLTEKQFDSIQDRVSKNEEDLVR